MVRTEAEAPGTVSGRVEPQRLRVSLTSWGRTGEARHRRERFFPWTEEEGPTRIGGSLRSKTAAAALFLAAFSAAADNSPMSAQQAVSIIVGNKTTHGCFLCQR